MKLLRVCVLTAVVIVTIGFGRELFRATYASDCFVEVESYCDDVNTGTCDDSNTCSNDGDSCGAFTEQNYSSSDIITTLSASPSGHAAGSASYLIFCSSTYLCYCSDSGDVDENNNPILSCSEDWDTRAGQTMINAWVDYDMPCP